MNSEDLPMNTNAHQGLQPGDAAQVAFKDSNRVNANSVTTDASKSGAMLAGVRRVRVRVVSENRLLHEGLLRMLGNHAGLQMLGGDVNEIFRVEKILEDSPDVLLLTSCGNLDSDISNTRKVRIAVPDVRIVMFGGAQGRRGQPAGDRTNLPYAGISVVVFTDRRDA